MFRLSSNRSFQTVFPYRTTILARRSREGTNVSIRLFTEVKVTLCQLTHWDVGSVRFLKRLRQPKLSQTLTNPHCMQARCEDGVEPILREAWSQGYPETAICVQRFDDSLNSAIRITYRISLRSSSLREPRYPSLRVVLNFVFFHPSEDSWKS